jgi:hypothetical protein
MRHSDVVKLAFLFVLNVACIGCSGGGDFGYVEGTVTLDGEPIENALIGFYPTEGRGSIGSTDSEGHYSLRYTASQKGASIGNHRVTVSTFIQEVKARANPRDPDQVVEAVAGRKELLDKSYQDRKNTPLTATVVPGTNPPINFDLKSK